MSGMALPEVVSRSGIGFTSGGMALLVANPGIEHAVQQVDRQVQH
jgi:hypothetical protein